jgi:hypothetical protein
MDLVLFWKNWIVCIFYDRRQITNFHHVNGFESHMWVPSIFQNRRTTAPSLETQFRKAYEHAIRLRSFYSSVENSLWKIFTIELRKSSLESPEEYYRSTKNWGTSLYLVHASGVQSRNPQ